MLCDELLLELLKGLPAAFVALVIGSIAAGIAYRQYCVARAKFKLDLFERRHEVFLKTWVFLSKFDEHRWKNNMSDIMIFRQYVANAKFLFGRDVADFVDKAEEMAIELGEADLYAYESPDEQQRAQAKQKLEEIQKWAHQQREQIHKKFSPYLGFSQWQ